MTAARKLRDGARAFIKLPVQDQKWVIEKLDRDRVLFPIGFKGRELPSRSLLHEIASALETTIDKPHVFLSHSSKDKRFVRGLAHKLKKAGIRVWLDEAEIKVGESLITKLQQALDQVDFLIVVLSRASVESPWVQRELEIAMTHEIQNRKVKVLPIMKETVRLPSFLLGKLYLDFRIKSTRAKSADKLVEHIQMHRRGR